MCDISKFFFSYLIYSNNKYYKIKEEAVFLLHKTRSMSTLPGFTEKINKRLRVVLFSKSHKSQQESQQLRFYPSSHFQL